MSKGKLVHLEAPDQVSSSLSSSSTAAWMDGGPLPKNLSFVDRSH